MATFYFLSIVWRTKTNAKKNNNVPKQAVDLCKNNLKNFTRNIRIFFVTSTLAYNLLLDLL